MIALVVQIQHFFTTMYSLTIQITPKPFFQPKLPYDTQSIYLQKTCHVFGSTKFVTSLKKPSRLF